MDHGLELLELSDIFLRVLANSYYYAHNDNENVYVRFLVILVSDPTAVDDAVPPAVDVSAPTLKREKNIQEARDDANKLRL